MDKKSNMSPAELKDLKKMYLILSLEWDTDKNGPIPPRNTIQDIAYNHVYWKCQYCNTTWKDQICNRLRGAKPCGCRN